MKTIATRLLVATFLFFGVLQISSASPVIALIGSGAKEQACKGVELDNATGANCGKDASKETQDIVQTVINILSAVGGIIAVIVIIVNGIRLVLSSGDSAKVNTARSGIIMAVVGLLVIALAQALVRFVVSRVA